MPAHDSDQFTPQTIEALVLAGGLGTRLHPLTQDTPKPMVPVAARPFLSYLLDELSRQSIVRAVLSIGHLGQQIRDHFGDRYGSMELVYAAETQPLGTGGAIVNSLGRLRGDDFLVLNGDTFMQLDYAALLGFHHAAKADISLCLKPMLNFDRYGNVVLSGNRVLAFEEKARHADRTDQRRRLSDQPSCILTFPNGGKVFF